MSQDLRTRPKRPSRQKSSPRLNHAVAARTDPDDARFDQAQHVRVGVMTKLARLYAKVVLKRPMLGAPTCMPSPATPETSRRRWLHTGCGACWTHGKTRPESWPGSWPTSPPRTNRYPPTCWPDAAGMEERTEHARCDSASLPARSSWLRPRLAVQPPRRVLEPAGNRRHTELFGNRTRWVADLGHHRVPDHALQGTKEPHGHRCLRRRNSGSPHGPTLPRPPASP